MLSKSFLSKSPVSETFVRSCPLRLAFARRAATCVLALGAAHQAHVAHAQCTQPASNCLAYNTGLAASSASTSDLAPGASVSAENLAFQGAGSLTDLCFWGRYDGTPPAVASESFTIVVYDDSGGFPGSVLAGPFVVGGATPTPGTLLTRGPALPASAGLNAFSWTVTLPAPGVSISAGQCVWVQIAGMSASAANKFNWLTTNSPADAPTGDNAYARRAGAAALFTIDDREQGFNLALCANLALASGGCAVTPAANATCAGAIALGPLPATQSATTTRGLLEPTPFCKTVLVGAKTLWYSLVGDGSTISLSTCDSTTNFDTTLSVYCGSCSPGNASALNCVASNDDALGTCSGSMTSGRASTLSFPTRAGDTYRIAVSGFAGQSGSFVLTASSNGVILPIAQQPVCSPSSCTVDLTGTSAGESETCGGASLNGECDDAGVVSAALGTTYRATLSATGTRDIDFFTIPNVPAAGASYDITIISEFPAAVVAYRGACTSSGANPGSVIGAAIVEPCLVPTSPTLQVDVPAGSQGGGARVLVTTPDFSGLPCGASNTYTLRITASLTGACCVLGQACVVVAQNTCAQLGGGAWYGPGTTCTPPSSGGDGCETVACCASSGACSLRTASDCTAAGLMAGASFSVCSPNPCPQPPSVCCRGATCATNVASNLCTGANTLFVPGLTNCNATFTSTTPCCNADFNKASGITVQDIFDFLNAWFAADPFANISNNGVGTPTVQSVFDYLTVWFAGGC